MRYLIWITGITLWLCPPLMAQRCETFPVIMELPWNLEELQAVNSPHKIQWRYRSEMLDTKNLRNLPLNKGSYFLPFRDQELGVWYTYHHGLLPVLAINQKKGNYYLEFCREEAFLGEDSLDMEINLWDGKNHKEMRILLNLGKIKEFMDADAVYLGPIEFREGNYRLQYYTQNRSSLALSKHGIAKYYDLADHKQFIPLE